MQQVEIAEEVVGAFGTSLEKQQLTMLQRELERSVTKSDNRAAQRACDEMEGLRWRVLGKQDWFWKEIFHNLQNSGGPFSDVAEARNQVNKGEAAIAAGNGEGLRAAVQALWKLQPKTEAEISKERALRSGLRKF